MYVVLNSVKKWFGVSASYDIPQTDNSILEDFRQFTMNSGVFGYDGITDAEAVMRQANNQNSSGARILALIYILFPPIDRLVDRYKYLEKYPVLLPFTWIQRLILNFKLIGKKTKQVGGIIAADNKEISELNVLYKNIGL